MIWKLSTVIAIVLLGGLIYQPGLQGHYIFDDFPNVVSNEKLHQIEAGELSILQAHDAGISGPLKRPLSMLSFAVNVSLTGFDPYYLKLTNLAIHMVNAFLIYLLCLNLLRLATRRNLLQESSGPRVEIIAFLAAMFWLVHPINLTSVLYVVQRMNALSALFVLAGLVAYLQLRNHEVSTGKSFLTARLIVVGVFTALAALSKENGLLLPVYVVLIELIFRNYPALRNTSKAALIAGSAVLLSVLAVAAVFVFSYLGYLDGYRNRAFDLEERLLTQARLIWFYIYIFILPNEYNINLYYDAFPISRSLINPVTTLVSILALIVTLISCCWYRYRHPVLVFGIALFLAGHLMESTIFPLEMVYIHRNYLPAIGLSLALVMFLASVIPARLRIAGLIGLVLLVAINATATRSIAGIWGNPILLAQSEVLNNPQSFRANYEMGRTLIIIYEGVERHEEVLLKGMEYFELSAEYDRQTTQPLLTLVMLASRHGLLVKDQWVDELKYRAEHEILVKGEADALSMLLQCHLQSRCEMSWETIDGILDAFMQNTISSPGRRNRLIALIEKYEAARNNISGGDYSPR